MHVLSSSCVCFVERSAAHADFAHEIHKISLYCFNPKLNTACTHSDIARSTGILRRDPFYRCQTRFPGNMIEVNPFASKAADCPYISLSQVYPAPTDEFLSCQRFCANAPVLVNGISMKIVKHVQQRGVLHLPQMHLQQKCESMFRKRK